MDKSISIVLLIMKKTCFIRAIFILLLVLWAVLIFVMSSQPAVQSSQTSNKFVVKIINFIYRDFSGYTAQQQNAITHTVTLVVRKAAHFFEYFVLGLLSSCVAATFKSKVCGLNFCAAAIFGVLYAVSDEVHQYFVPGRACRLGDICIDSAGVILATAFALLLAAALKRRKSGGKNAEKEIN